MCISPALCSFLSLEYKSLRKLDLIVWKEQHSIVLRALRNDESEAGLNLSTGHHVSTVRPHHLPPFVLSVSLPDHRPPSPLSLLAPLPFSSVEP